MEAELDDKRREQRVAEERLKQREAALDEREIDLLQRELNMMIQQQQGVNATPTPHRRRGKFTKSRLKLLTKKDSAQSSAIISLPSGKTIITLITTRSLIRN